MFQHLNAPDDRLYSVKCARNCRGREVAGASVAFSQLVIWALKRGRVRLSQVIGINLLDIYLIFVNFYEMLKVFVYLLANLCGHIT